MNQSTTPERGERKQRVLIVDRRPVVRAGIATILEREPELECCEGGSNPAEAGEAIRRFQPNLILIDLSRRNPNGWEMVKQFRAEFPALPILIFSDGEEDLYAERLMHSGARGFLTQSAAPETLLNAVRTVLRGSSYCSAEMSQRLARRTSVRGRENILSPLSCLSNRELQVFQMIGQGMGTRVISETLHLSVKTIETYRDHLKKKLDLKNAVELVRCAVEWSEESQSARTPPAGAGVFRQEGAASAAVGLPASELKRPR